MQCWPTPRTPTTYSPLRVSRPSWAQGAHQLLFLIVDSSRCDRPPILQIIRQYLVLLRRRRLPDHRARLLLCRGSLGQDCQPDGIFSSSGVASSMIKNEPSGSADGRLGRPLRRILSADGHSALSHSNRCPFVDLTLVLFRAITPRSCVAARVSAGCAPIATQALPHLGGSSSHGLLATRVILSSCGQF